MESGICHLGGRKWVKRNIERCIHSVGCVIFPHFCLACGLEGKLLCQTCEMKYALNRGVLFSMKIDNTKTIRCFSVGYYADPALHNLLHLYKYNRVEEAGEIYHEFLSIQQHGTPLLYWWA